MQPIKKPCENTSKYFISLLTKLITTWNKTLLGKLALPQLSKKFPALFYVFIYITLCNFLVYMYTNHCHRMFTQLQLTNISIFHDTALITARQLSLSMATTIQSTPKIFSLKIYFNIIIAGFECITLLHGQNISEKEKTKASNTIFLKYQ
jgi:hypothetical protein